MNFITLLQEMAATHMGDEVAKLMIKGEKSESEEEKKSYIKKAVEKYIQNMLDKKAKVAKTSTAVTKKIKEGRPPKSLKISDTQLGKISKESWDKFDEIYKEEAKDHFVSKERKKSETQKGQAVKNKEGEEVGMTGGQRQDVIKRELSRAIYKAKTDLEKGLENAKSDEEKKNFEEYLKGLETLYKGFQASGVKGILKHDPEKKREQYKKIQTQREILKDPERINLEIEKLEKEKENAKTPKEKRRFDQRISKLKKQKENLGEAVSYNTSDELKKINKSIYDKLIKLAKTYKKGSEEQKNILKLAKQASSMGSVNSGVVREYVEIYIPSDNKMSMMAEGINYQGAHFSENYIFSKFVKAFYNDKNKYGTELTEDIYKKIYGEDVSVLISLLKENEEFLNEAGQSKSSLIFEGYSELDNELVEGIWEQIKKFGGASIGKLQNFLGKGVAWAKELVSKGTDFFTELPIAQIAIPAIAISGGIAAGAKLINNIRKKAGKNPLSKEEKEKFKELVKQKENEVEKYI